MIQQKGEFYTFLWKCVINIHRRLTVVENSWIETLKLLTWLSLNWRALIWLKLHGYDGIRETGLQSLLFRNKGSHHVMREVGIRKRQRQSFWLRSYFWVEMGLVWHSTPKKDGRQSERNSFFHSVNHQLLKRMKTTLFLHVNGTPFICTH